MTPTAQAQYRPDPDKGRRQVGLTLWIIGMLIGVVLNILFFGLEIAASDNPSRTADAMLLGAISAFGMVIFYLVVPRVLDRYDPEPWWCLLMAFLWGAVVATGVAGTVNTIVHVWGNATIGEPGASLVTTVISAPVSEEIMKGALVWGLFVFLRREFDGVVDGIIYATFCALGFAAVENVQYYARAALQGQDVFAQTFVLRGLVAPWGHPLYTSMTGIGVGIARESTKTWVRWLAPLGGLCAAMFLHAVWNFVPNLGGAVFLVSLLFWFAFVGLFLLIIIVLVVRKGRVIREYLRDELAMGTLSQPEVDLICSPVARMRTLFDRQRALKRRLIRVGARLALAKWHTVRAQKGQKRTISVEFIGPLRQEMATIRRQLATT